MPFLWGRPRRAELSASWRVSVNSTDAHPREGPGVGGTIDSTLDDRLPTSGLLKKLAFTRSLPQGPMQHSRLVATFLLTLASASGHADIYGYVDEQGVSHFSAEKSDARYQLLVRGNSFGSLVLEPSGRGKQVLANRLIEHPKLKTYEPMLKTAGIEFAVELALLKASGDAAVGPCAATFRARTVRGTSPGPATCVSAAAASNRGQPDPRAASAEDPATSPVPSAPPARNAHGPTTAHAPSN